MGGGLVQGHRTRRLEKRPTAGSLVQSPRSKHTRGPSRLFRLPSECSPRPTQPCRIYPPTSPHPRGGGHAQQRAGRGLANPARVPQKAQSGPRHAARVRGAASSSLRGRNSPLPDSLAGRGGSAEPGSGSGSPRGRRRLRPAPPPTRGRAPRAAPSPRPPPTGPPARARGSALGGGVLPQPPSFPGEEQRIAQASGSGGGGGRKGERRKRDLNERR